MSDYVMQGTNFIASITGGSLAGQGASVAYGPTLFSSVVPYLTSNTYNALQGLNASGGLTLTFNGFSAAAGASSAGGDIVIYNPSNDAVLYRDDFVPGVTSALLAADTLAAGTTYNLFIEYSNLASTWDAGFGGAPFSVVYDNRDLVSFTTASPIPEPAGITLMAIGGAMIAVARRRPADPSA